jgi:hypothetical protein
MEDRADSGTPSQRATAEINQVIEIVSAEIATRKMEAHDASAHKQNRRFASAKAANLSEAADIARAAARQLAAAKARVVDEVTKAEAAGFVVQEDFSVIKSPSGSSRSRAEADNHAAAIRAAVTDFMTLDKQVAVRLDATAEGLRDLSDN